LVLPAFAFLLIMIIVPACTVVWNSIAVPQANGRRVVGLHLYQSLLSDPINRHDIIFTLIITVTTVGLLLPLCYALALYLRFARGPLVGVYRFLCIIPLFVPTIISAFAFITFFQNQGVLDSLLRVLGIEQALHLTYNEPINDRAGVGIILGEIWNSIPVTVLLLGAGLSDIDNALIEAARDVGAGSWAIFVRIVVPLTIRPALIAVTLSFMGVLGSFTIPYLLGPTAPQMLGPLLDTIFASYREPLQAGALAVVMFLLSLLVGVTYVIVVSRRSVATGRAI
jgi:ABC-type spermidine/putrescine transport system permease subunit I